MTHRWQPLFALFARALRDDVRAKFPPILRSLTLVALIFSIWSLERLILVLPAPGLTVLGNVAGLNFLGITILGLATFASAITEEKDDDTLGLLRMTELSPLAILLGKSTSRLVGGLLFLLAQLPFALLSATLGGVYPGQIFAAYAILCAYLFFLCNLGLLCSVICRTTARAVTATTIVCLLLFVLPPCVYFSSPFLQTASHPAVQFFRDLVLANPYLDLGNIFNGRFIYTARVPGTAVLLGAGALCFVTAWLGFERFAGAGQSSSSASPASARRGGSVPRARDAALAWKDFYFANGGSRRVVFCLAAYLAASLLHAWWNPHAHTDPIYQFALAAQFCGTLGLGVQWALACAAIFGRERQQQTLGTLCILPVPLDTLIWQKIRGSAIALLPALLLAVGATFLRNTWEELAAFNLPGRPSAHFAGAIHVAAQFLFFGLLIATLSLYLRRGALPSALMACVFWNILLFSFVINAGSPSNEKIRLAAADLLLALLSVFLARHIVLRLPACAAED